VDLREEIGQKMWLNMAPGKGLLSKIIDIAHRKRSPRT